jgi:hypothetical protein
MLVRQPLLLALASGIQKLPDLLALPSLSMMDHLSVRGERRLDGSFEALTWSQL